MDDQMIDDAVAGLLDRHGDPGASDGDPESPMATRVWDALAAAGFPWVSVPEAAGGSGGTLGDAASVLWQIGRRAVPLPVAETGVLGGWLLAQGGLALPPGPVTLDVAGPAVGGAGATAARLTGGPGGWRLSARLRRVPWARAAEQIVTLADRDGRPYVVAVPSDVAQVSQGLNLAGEPRDGVVVDAPVPDGAVAPVPSGTGEHLVRRGALARTALMAGALERVGELATGYANEREQFGRPIISFQAVASHVVRITEEVEGAALAAHVALATYDEADGTADEAADGTADAARNAADEAAFAAAAAKVCASSAAGVVARLAHQVHGAIGMTEEYELGRLTRRLWCWRQEFGSARAWSRWLGERAIERGADQLWPTLTGGGRP